MEEDCAKLVKLHGERQAKHLCGEWLDEICCSNKMR